MGSGSWPFFPAAPGCGGGLLGAETGGQRSGLVFVSHCKVLFLPLKSLLGVARGHREASVALCGVSEALALLSTGSRAGVCVSHFLWPVCLHGCV